ncbi:MAG: PKD domain-containing protein, partial [Crocinitomicaceae bacterium]|nr:PKD domain-containing protein [Crocinitomicaceae bacterium]
NGMGLGGVTPSFGAYIDTYQNSDPDSDPWEDHISINANGDVVHDGGPDDLAGPATIPNIEDCNWHEYRVVWDPIAQLFEIYLDGALVLSYTGDIINTIFGGDPNVYWGFTGATGGLTNQQQFCTQLQAEWQTVATSACAGQSVQFSDNSSSFGVITSWTWDFGDGNTGSGTSPTHTYAADGTYTVQLTITDASGCSDTYSFPIEIASPSVTASASPNSICPGQTSQLDAVAAAPPPPPSDYTITLWDSYGDGWNNGQIEVFVDGISVGTYTINDPGPTNGEGPETYTIPVTDGAVVTATYTAGSYSSENYYYIYDNNNNVVVDDGCGGNGCTPSGGTAPAASIPVINPIYDYLWTPNTNLSADNIQNPTANPTSTTIYTVTITDQATGCTATDTVQITVVNSVTADAGPDQTYCFGGPAVTIGADPVTTDAGATYTWNNGAGNGIIDLQGGGQDNGQATVSPATTTTYILTVDFNGCTATDSVTVVVDMPPIASNPISMNVQCSGLVPAPDVNVVTDEADDFTVSPIVTWVSDVSDGLSCPETITRTYRVTDDCGNFVDVTQTIIANDTEAPIFAAVPADVTVQCIGDVPAMTNLGWTDNCDGAGSVAGTDGVLVGGNCGGTITRTWTYTDVCGNVATTTQTITIDDNIAPVFAAAPVDVTIQCIGDVPAMTNLGWTDNCDGTGSVTGTDGAIVGGNCGGTITRTWTYTDVCGNVATTTQTITVNDNIAPVLAAAPADVTVQCIGDVPAMTNLGWTDNCDGAGSIAGTDGALVGGSCGGTITRTWTYTDACGNIATSVSQTITVNDNIAPVLAAEPADVIVQCIGDLPAMTDLGWTDNCDGAGTVTGTDAAIVGGNCGGTITRTWTYTDVCGNAATTTQTITVNDNIAPVFAAAPGNITVQCIGDVPAMANLGWTDNCDGAGSVTGTDGAIVGGNCGGTITRTWTYTDACGNVATTTQTITVDDTTPPVLVAPPANITVECSGDVPAMVNLGYTDNCDAPGTVVGTDVSDGLTCPETITRTWTYTDACGNVSSVSQTITIDDTTPPTGTAPGPVAGSVAPAPDVTLITDEVDICTVTPTVTFVSDVSDGGNCPEIITRTYRITDDCGNFTDVIQLITIGDSVLPTASNPVGINVECIADVPVPDPLVVTDEADNGATPIVTWEDDTSDGLSCPETITRRYRVTDDCGN